MDSAPTVVALKLGYTNRMECKTYLVSEKIQSIPLENHARSVFYIRLDGAARQHQAIGSAEPHTPPLKTWTSNNSSLDPTKGSRFS